jgi:hypothetical protein
MKSFDAAPAGVAALKAEVLQHPTHAYLIECPASLTGPVLSALAPVLLFGRDESPVGSDVPDWRVVGMDKRVGRPDVATWPEEAIVPPIAALHKVLVVVGAERMTDEAQNLLLKVVEEPPPTAVTLMVAEQALSVAVTLRSRCRQLALRPAPVRRTASAAAQELLNGRVAGDEWPEALAEAAELIRDHIADPRQGGGAPQALVDRWAALEEAAQALEQNANRELVAWRLARRLDR